MISDSKKNMGVIQFTFWIEVICSGLLFPWCFVGKEIETFLTTSFEQLIITILVAAYGGVRIMSQFYFLKFTSPTSLSLSNICIQIFTILFGILIFDNKIEPIGMLGICISLIFSAIYIYIKLLKCLNCNGFPKECIVRSHERVPLKDLESDHEVKK